MDNGAMGGAVNAANQDLQGFPRMQEGFAAALQGNHLLMTAMGLAAQFEKAVAVFEAGSDGFALEALERQQVVVNLEWHARVLTAVRQLLKEGRGLHDVIRHARNDEETEGEVEKAGCGLAGHWNRNRNRQIRGWRRAVVRSVFIIERNIIERYEGKCDGTRIGGAGFFSPKWPDDSGALAWHGRRIPIFMLH
jgi:hypothetical protein